LFILGDFETGSCYVAQAVFKFDSLPTSASQMLGLVTCITMLSPPLTYILSFLAHIIVIHTYRTQCVTSCTDQIWVMRTCFTSNIHCLFVVR
jgi:hypothetical protein